MNERIDKLFSDAIELTIKDPRDLRGEDWDNECRKKFAELIVRECARRSYLEDSRNPEVEEALEFWRKDMLKHFGVEE